MTLEYRSALKLWAIDAVTYMTFVYVRFTLADAVMVKPVIVDVPVGNPRILPI
jgi:hypothetical protein